MKPHAYPRRRLACWILSFCAAAGSTLGQAIPEPSLVQYGVIRSGLSRITTGTLVWHFQSAGRSVLVSAPLTNINDQFSYLLLVPCETELPGLFAASSNALALVSTPRTFDRSQVFVIAGETNAATFVEVAQAATQLTSLDRGRLERIDLTVSGSMTDKDGNGLPDAWEIQYFGHTGVNPNDDPDHDGMANWMECRAGTDPNDPNSRFAFIRVSKEAGGTRVTWSSATGTYYILQRIRSLISSPENVWSTVQSHVSAAGLETSCLDTNALGSETWFYRLQIE